VTILVSDTSVLIDLERGQFLDCCFRLAHEFAVPDLLYRRELADFGGPELIKRGLRVEELTKDELTAVQDVRGKRPQLSSPLRPSISLRFLLSRRTFFVSRKTFLLSRKVFFR
jgi:hypothetical protein